MLPNHIENIDDTSNLAEVPKNSSPNNDLDVQLVQRKIIKAVNELYRITDNHKTCIGLIDSATNHNATAIKQCALSLLSDSKPQNVIPSDICHACGNCVQIRNTQSELIDGHKELSECQEELANNLNQVKKTTKQIGEVFVLF